TNGKRFGLTDPEAKKTVREAVKASACARFMTVLGPGSDGYHEEHIRLDLAERSNGFRLCHWEVNLPVPLPRPRPPEASTHAATEWPRCVALTALRTQDRAARSAVARSGVQHKTRGEAAQYCRCATLCAGSRICAPSRFARRCSSGIRWEPAVAARPSRALPRRPAGVRRHSHRSTRYPAGLGLLRAIGVAQCRRRVSAAPRASSGD